MTVISDHPGCWRYLRLARAPRWGTHRALFGAVRIGNPEPRTRGPRQLDVTEVVVSGLASLVRTSPPRGGRMTQHGPAAQGDDGTGTERR
jgi:hypothetical protein